MRSLLIPILLQLAGVVVIIAEFIVPSFGILTVTAIAVFGFSIYYVFANVSTTAGAIFVAVDMFLIPIVVVIGVRFLAASPVTLRSRLNREDGAVSQPKEWELLIGKTGETITDLRPAGTILIDGKRTDVVSRGEYIQKGTSVIVVAADSNRIVVGKAS